MILSQDLIFAFSSKVFPCCFDYDFIEMTFDVDLVEFVRSMRSNSVDRLWFQNQGNGPAGQWIDKWYTSSGGDCALHKDVVRGPARYRCR